MRLLSLAVVGLFSFLSTVVAQEAPTLPACATSCALGAIGDTGCAVTNATCICQATSFLTTVQTCISTACNATDQAGTLAYAQSFCLSGGVTITLPTGSAIEAPTAASSTPPSSSTPASVPATVTPSTTGSPSTVAPSGSAATFTGAANALIQQWGILGVLGLGVAVAL